MNKPYLFVLIGLPGCGKSTIAKEISNLTDAEVFSSDSIRKELFGSEAMQYSNDYLKEKGFTALSDNQKRNICNNAVFAELNNRIRNCLSSGSNAVYDATNLTHRNDLHSRFPNAEIVLVCIDVALETALVRNQIRDRHVPENVIRDLYQKYSSEIAEMKPNCQFRTVVHIDNN